MKTLEVKLHLTATGMYTKKSFRLLSDLANNITNDDLKYYLNSYDKIEVNLPQINSIYYRDALEIDVHKLIYDKTKIDLKRIKQQVEVVK